MRSPALPAASALAASLALVLGLAAAAPDDTPSALESDPKGWTDLLAQAGPGLKGWTLGPIPPTAKLNEEPPSQWSLDPATGVLLCRGDRGHEWLRWDQEAGDLVFHVEWKFTPVEGKTTGYNSGIYARNSADAKIWHQAQTGPGPVAYLFGDTLVNGKLQRVNLSKQVLDRRVKPPGQWNTTEITCRGKTMTLWVNGSVACVFDACEVPRGYVGLEAEGYRIEFRNVKLKVLNR